MAIQGWISFGLISLLIIGVGVIAIILVESTPAKVLSAILAIAAIITVLCGMTWYYNNTADGKRAMVDQESNFSNGIYRTITVYTADGKVIAEYTGKIDIEGNDGGYVLFDFEGKRYTYYNCFVESVADIE